MISRCTIDVLELEAGVAELMGMDLKYLKVLLSCVLDDVTVYNRYA